jgi:hypothetical protein
MSKAPRRGPPRDPWVPPAYDDFDIGTIKALNAGHASEGQQRHALRFLVEKMCGTYDLSFRPGTLDGQRATDFAEGRRFVGLQIVKLINMDMPTNAK